MYSSPLPQKHQRRARETVSLPLLLTLRSGSTSATLRATSSSDRSELAPKGWRPVSSTHITTPRAHMSTFSSTDWRASTSGALSDSKRQRRGRTSGRSRKRKYCEWGGQKGGGYTHDHARRSRCSGERRVWGGAGRVCVKGRTRAISPYFAVRSRFFRGGDTKHVNR